MTAEYGLLMFLYNMIAIFIGAVIEESQKVLFKQELDKKGKKCINTYLEVYIK